ASDFTDNTSRAKEGASLYLYRVAVNSTRRNLPPCRTPDGRLYRPPMPLDLYYLLTPWAETAEKQQLLLGFCMRTLEDMTILPTNLLNRFHYSPDTETFREGEMVELVSDPISLQDLTSIWYPFMPNVHLSVGYVARMVAIASTLQETEAPPVQTRVFDFGKAGVS